MVRGMASAKRAVEGGLRFIQPSARVSPLVLPHFMVVPAATANQLCSLIRPVSLFLRVLTCCVFMVLNDIADGRSQMKANSLHHYRHRKLCS